MSVELESAVRAFLDAKDSTNTYQAVQKMREAIKRIDETPTLDSKLAEKCICSVNLAGARFAHAQCKAFHSERAIGIVDSAGHLARIDFDQLREYLSRSG